MNASKKSNAPRTEKTAQDDKQACRTETADERQNKEPVEPLDEESLDSVMRDCPL
jgi:hypothetical protein